MRGASKRQSCKTIQPNLFLLLPGNFKFIQNQLNLMNKALLNGFLLLLTTLFLANVSVSTIQAQPSCEISIDKPLPVCPNSKFQLSVTAGEGYKYVWRKDGDSIASTPSILIKLTEEAEFVVRITDTINFEECESDPFVVGVYPIINIEFEQLQLTCTQTFLDLPEADDKAKTAVVKAMASGDFEADEYHYIWEVAPKQISPNDSSTALGLKAHLFYNIQIRDDYGCTLDTSFWTEAYDNPEAEIFADPDTAYIQKPYITFTYDNLSADSIDIINHFWEVEIGDPSYPDSVLEFLEPNPTVTYFTVGSWPVYLTVYNPQGCDTLFSREVDILPVDIFIPNVFTPNGDDMNQKFKIAMEEGEGNYNTDLLLSEYYNSSKLVVFNRWGIVVFESDDYQNDWEGGDLPDGVYYYVLKCYGQRSNDVYKGAVSIVGSGRQ